MGSNRRPHQVSRFSDSSTPFLLRLAVLVCSRPAFWLHAGAFPFHVNIIQVILYPLLHSVFASNLIAHTLFAIGVAVWILMLWRTSFRISTPLAISSLLALSFLSLYHSVSDATILTLALCWAIPAEHQPWTRIKIVTCVLFFLMMLPGHSALMRLSPKSGRPSRQRGGGISL